MVCVVTLHVNNLESREKIEIVDCIIIIEIAILVA